MWTCEYNIFLTIVTMLSLLPGVLFVTFTSNKGILLLIASQIVFNPVNYPNFIRFLQMYPKLKDAIIPSLMHFSVCRDDGLSEWAFRGLKSVFSQTKNVLDRNTWRMIYDILRFNSCARRLISENEKNLAAGRDSEITIGEYLEREGYSDAFRDNMLIVRSF
jgi:predicted NAD/FAD-binding protein